MKRLTWIRRINVVKMLLNTQSNLQIQCNPYQNTNNIFHKTDNNIKICMEAHTEKNNKCFLTSKQCDTGLETDRDQRNRTESRNIPTHTWSINLWNRSKDIQWGKDRLLSKWCSNNQTVTCEIIKLHYFLSPYVKNKLKVN